MLITLFWAVGHPFSLAFALIAAALVLQFHWEAQAVRERGEALMTLSTEKGLPYWLTYGTILRGWALNAQSEGMEGIAQMC